MKGGGGEKHPSSTLHSSTAPVQSTLATSISVCSHNHYEAVDVFAQVVVTVYCTFSTSGLLHSLQFQRLQCCVQSEVLINGDYEEFYFLEYV
jgi:hypothetical protein